MLERHEVVMKGCVVLGLLLERCQRALQFCTQILLCDAMCRLSRRPEKVDIFLKRGWTFVWQFGLRGDPCFLCPSGA